MHVVARHGRCASGGAAARGAAANAVSARMQVSKCINHFLPVPNAASAWVGANVVGVAVARIAGVRRIAEPLIPIDLAAAAVAATKESQEAHTSAASAAAGGSVAAISGRRGLNGEKGCQGRGEQHSRQRQIHACVPSQSWARIQGAQGRSPRKGACGCVSAAKAEESRKSEKTEKLAEECLHRRLLPGPKEELRRPHE